jgi:glycosyltransferase involved in cell wall biosynthesis
LKPQTPAKNFEISLIIPFIDNWDITANCLSKLVHYTTQPTELVLIDNGSDENYRAKAKEATLGSHLHLKYVRNELNIGVLPTFKQGLEESKGKVLVYIHNDVLIHEPGWNERIVKAFNDDPQLGLAGLFGARGVNHDGGREGSMSHMLGQEWGKCECHSPAALHHGELHTGEMAAAVFDGVGLFFRRTVLQDLADHTDLFADWRAPHHFYDRIMSVKVAARGHHMKMIGIKFDHYSGATANHSQKYADFGKNWLESHGHTVNATGIDDTIYWLAESQWRTETNDLLPLKVDMQGNYTWKAL